MNYPEYIYHYTKAENLFKILPKLYLKMGPSKETNDPREKMIYNATINVNSKHAYKCLDIIKRYNSGYARITCFSGDSEKLKGYNLPTMWAHYTDNYKGIALKINTNEFINQNKKSMYFDRINYSFSKSVIKIEKNFSPEELRSLMFFSKRPDWESEQEWRLLSLSNQKLCSIKDSLKSVILGLDFDNNLLQSLQNLLIGTSIKIEKLKLDNATQNFFLEDI